jgi:hypothetical protein
VEARANAHIRSQLVGVKGVMVDVFNLGAGVEGELMDFDDGGDSSLSYFSNACAAGSQSPQRSHRDIP